MKTFVIGLVVGLVVGIVGAVVLPTHVGSLVPSALRGNIPVVEGKVEAKRVEPKRLLLTIRTAQGSTLATFKKKVAEIDLLVDEGDTLSLGLREYEPFVEDPPIRRVAKPDDPPSFPHPGPADTSLPVPERTVPTEQPAQPDAEPETQPD